MNWLADHEAHYRLRHAVEAGKVAVRKIDGRWILFVKPHALPTVSLRAENHAAALENAIRLARP